VHRTVKVRYSIGLRPAVAGDFEFLARIRRDKELQESLMNHPSPERVNDEEIKKWIARRTSEEGGTFQIVVDDAQKQLGFVQIFHVQRKSRNGKLGMAIVSDARSRGVGREALRHLCAYARDALQLHKLLLEVRIDNLAAIRLYESSGFSRVGVLHDHYYDGRNYHDVLQMERLLAGEQSL